MWVWVDYLGLRAGLLSLRYRKVEASVGLDLKI